jgi:predicted O-methyltransferase YrrM
MILSKYRNKPVSWWLETPTYASRIVRKHLKDWRSSRSVRSWRPDWCPRLLVHNEEKVYPHLPQDKANLFLAFNGTSTEIETLNWLHATICLTKPNCVLETGAYDGMGTIALASACRANGFGKVHSVEIDSEMCKRLDEKLRRYGLRDWVEIHNSDSITYLKNTNESFDFGFYDSDWRIRPEEYEICMRRGIIKGIAAFHDTSNSHEFYNKPEDIEAFIEFRDKLLDFAAAQGGCFNNQLSRGLLVIFPR